MASIVRDFGLAVLVRNGSDPYKYVYENDLLAKYSHNIDIIFDWIGDDLSSTKVRWVTASHPLQAHAAIALQTLISAAEF